MADSIAPDCISNMYRQNHGWLLGWLRGKLGNAFDAADVAQDIYVRVIDTGRLPEYEQQSRAYLARIAKHLVVDLQRRRRVEYAYLEALLHFLPTRCRRWRNAPSRCKLYVCSMRRL